MNAQTEPGTASGHERLDVVHRDRLRRPVEGQLVELVGGHPGLVSPVGVVVEDESTDPLRELPRGAGREPHLALAGLGLDPAGQLAGLRGAEGPDFAADRPDGVDDPLLTRLLRPARGGLDEGDAAARGDERQDREQRVAVLALDRQRADVRHDAQRPAAEHRLGRHALVELADELQRPGSDRP